MALVFSSGSYDIIINKTSNALTRTYLIERVIDLLVH